MTAAVKACLRLPPSCLGSAGRPIGMLVVLPGIAGHLALLLGMQILGQKPSLIAGDDGVMGTVFLLEDVTMRTSP